MIIEQTNREAEVTAQIIDGKAIAQKVRQEVRQEVIALSSQGIVPGLAVILVGDEPYYARFDVRPAAFPEMERYFSEALTLPIYYGLAAEDQELVIARVLDLCR